MSVPGFSKDGKIDLVQLGDARRSLLIFLGVGLCIRVRLALGVAIFNGVLGEAVRVTESGLLTT